MHSNTLSKPTIKKVGVAGIGAIGNTVCKALLEGIEGYVLHAISDIDERQDMKIPNLLFEEMAVQCDLVIECLPPQIVPKLAEPVLSHGKDLVIISSCALLMYPEILDKHALSTSRIIVPSGALIGIDGVNALKNLGIESAKIISTKPPMGFSTAPYVEINAIDLTSITTPARLFEGNALEASKGFPANVNVAATLSFAGIGAENTKVEIWADPHTEFNSHEIIVESAFSRIIAKVQNKPDPANPKTSMLAAQSIIATLRGFSEPFAVL
ncbi:MAG: aspartate dehydrogenase domain-containing protein [Alphaproteobacteria bacterium]